MHVIHQQAQGPPPRPADERARAHAPRLRRRDVHALRRLRARLGHRLDHRGALGPEPAAGAAGEALRHRLLVEDHGLLRERRARLQRRARPHALGRDRRQRGQQEPALHRRVGRRRLAVHRLRPVRACHPPQREHALHLREQRRVRAHQGPVLRLRRRRHASRRRARRTSSRRSTRASPRSRSAAPSSRAVSPATRSSSCR